MECVKLRLPASVTQSLELLVVRYRLVCTLFIWPAYASADTAGKKLVWQSLVCCLMRYVRFGGVHADGG